MRAGGSSSALQVREAGAEPVDAFVLRRASDRPLGPLEAERDRWFLWLPILLALGIGLYFAMPTEPGLLPVLAILLGALVVRVLWQEGTLACITGSALLAVAAGFALAKLESERVRAPVIERSMHNVEVAGFVELVEPRPTRGQRITLRVVEIGALDAAARPTRVRIRTMKALAGLAPGDAVRIRATLAPPALPTLPGDHDFARTAWLQRLGAVGYALAAPRNADGLGPPPPALAWWATVERLRQNIAARISAALPGQQGAIATALITGERGGISEATNDAFRDSGLFHILSISGLHMTIMAGSVFFALRLAIAGFPAIALRIDAKRWAAGGAMVAAFLYLLISGAAFATVRSWLMISIMLLAVLLGRPALALRNVALSAIAILAVFPQSLLDVGFQMSFAAVTALVAAYEWLREREQPESDHWLVSLLLRFLLGFGGIILSTLIATIAVAPYAAYHFHKSQQLALVANLIAVPVCNLVVMPASLVALLALPFGLEAPPLALMGLGIDAMMWTATWVAELPGAVVRIPPVPTLSFLAMVGGSLWICLWRRGWRLLGAMPVLAGIATVPLARTPDMLVGRDGALVAVRTPDGNLSALASGNVRFELARWLEHDGDPRAPADAQRAEAFRCDAVGCTARLKGIPIAVSRHPAALADDCRSARILVLTMPQPRACIGPDTVIDFFALRSHGTHALYVDDGRVRIQTVAEYRGARPWTPPVRPAPATSRRPLPRAASRLAGFAPPHPLAAPAFRPRPEIEDDDALPDEPPP
jgi:competence protein ComEC